MVQYGIRDTVQYCVEHSLNAKLDVNVLAKNLLLIRVGLIPDFIISSTCESALNTCSKQ